MPDGNRRRNIVLISLDDAVAYWKYKTLFGLELQTPNLDRICEQSTAFHSAYCQAPVCSPSRASFMSGRTPHQTGIVKSDNKYMEKIPLRAMWPHRLKQSGYFCSSGGKVMRGLAPLPDRIHKALFSDEPKNFSVERRAELYRKGKVPDADLRTELGGFRGGQVTPDGDEDRNYYDYQVAESAADFVTNYDGDAPFYREVGLTGTHGPWSTPRRFKVMYTPGQFVKPTPWKAGFPRNPIMDKDAPENLDITDRRHWKLSLRNYFAAITHTDTHIGRVFDAIKASPHADDTLIILVSDHGLHLGEHNRFRKHTLLEQVANVPLIIHDPARPVKQVITDPVALIDIAPTVMDYAGLPPMPGRVGRSLLPMMAGERSPHRAVPTFLNGSAGVRKGKYRMIRYEDGSTQFFDLENDWWQTRDLGPRHPDYARMMEAHARCCQEYGMELETA